MPTPENSSKTVCFIDYVPAELRENKRWEIIYYIRCPYENKLQRKAVRVKPIKSITERRKMGKRMAMEINKKLESGWNPLYSSAEAKSFKPFVYACELFLSRIRIQVKRNELRIDTLRSYTSITNNFLGYLKDIGKEEIFCINYTPDLILGFLDMIYYDRENSARTRNNYLNFLNTLSKWLIDNSFISENPTLKISVIKESAKKRIVITDLHLKQIFNHLKQTNPEYFTICLCCYYCLIRRTEMTKLKVKDVVLQNGIIYIEKDSSKNKKSQPVTIPDSMMPIMANHLRSATQNDYLFSKNLRPGNKQLKPKKISDLWDKVRLELKLPNEYQWYSLKDTGITNLLIAGVPIIAVRDQARHSDIKQTDAYTPKQILKANGSIKSAFITG